MEEINPNMVNVSGVPDAGAGNVGSSSSSSSVPILGLGLNIHSNQSLSSIHSTTTSAALNSAPNVSVQCLINTTSSATICSVGSSITTGISGVGGLQLLPNVSNLTNINISDRDRENIYDSNAGPSGSRPIGSSLAHASAAGVPVSFIPSKTIPFSGQMMMGSISTNIHSSDYRGAMQMGDNANSSLASSSSAINAGSKYII